MERIRDRAFDGFVVLREWAISKSRERREDSSHAFGINDEWSHVIGRLRIDFEIGNVVATPSLLRFVPPNLPSFTGPGFTVWIARSAVVHHAPVCRPRPGPVRINTETGRIVRIPPLHQCAGFGP